MADSSGQEPPAAKNEPVQPTAQSPPAAQTDRPHVEVDLEATDNDSSYGNELSVYSASLTSSVLDYRHENGLRYHGYRDGTYLLPNDENESDRLDMMHELFLTLLKGELYLAPIGPAPQRVIDIGTGTGLWAIEFGDNFPSAEVIGVDLSPTQPRMVPPNVKFMVDDIEEEWIDQNNPFDFIHARYLAHSIKDFPKLLKQCYSCTKPGGWVEFQDWNARITSEDGTLDGTELDRYYKEVMDAFEKAGYRPDPGPHLEQWMREAGFVDVHVHRDICPMGAWAKDPLYKRCGTWMMLVADQGFRGAAMAVMTRFESWSNVEVELLAANARRDLKDRRIHGLFHFYDVYGRRPE